jgi:hypothetical protein
MLVYRSVMILSIVLFCTAASSKEVAPPTFEYSYHDAVNGDLIQISSSRGAVTYGDVAVTYICPPNTTCALGGRIRLILPDNWIEKKTWKADGMTFRAGESTSIKHLGRSFEAHMIRSERQGISFWYLVSPKDGLIAFGLGNEKEALQYWLVESCGLGASRSCAWRR